MNFISAVKFHHFIKRLTLFKKCSPQIWIRYQTTAKDSPVKYSGSKAAGWKAAYTRSGEPKDESPWYQPYVVCSSVAIFLVYFCILREENDIDDQLNISLYDRIDGLEKSQLKTTLEYYQEKGINSDEVRKRLEELENNETR